MELKINAGRTVRIIVDDDPDPDAIAFGIAKPLPPADLRAAAFMAGYEAGWERSCEGNNAEFSGLTAAEWEAGAKAALDAYLAGLK